MSATIDDVMVTAVNKAMKDLAIDAEAVRVGVKGDRIRIRIYTFAHRLPELEDQLRDLGLERGTDWFVG